MFEVVIEAADEQAMVGAFASIDAVDDNGDIITNGSFENGGSYFINLVGTVYQPTGNRIKDPLGNDVPEMAPVPGYWGRIRINAAPGSGDGDLPASLTKYIYDEKTELWVNSVTNEPAPDYVKDIGLIL